MTTRVRERGVLLLLRAGPVGKDGNVRRARAFAVFSN